MKINKSKLEKGDFDTSIRFAIRNIVKFGDTDIFPFPLETRMLDDFEDRVLELFQTVHSEFEKSLNTFPPLNVDCCSTVGYYGFRWATQIDPMWNVYFLGLVVSLAKRIEDQRLSHEHVYSYRIALDVDKYSLYSDEINWRKFQSDSLEFCEKSEKIEHVVVCDIADFYTRIYHHRLENALDRLDPGKNVSSKIKGLVQYFSGTNSYGLPVGGAASRILSELVLDSVDRILKLHRIEFKRYVDDYVIFCESKEDAHSALAFLSRKLMENEGLTLQKHKTNIMSKDEFVNITKAKLKGVDEDEKSPMKAKFMSLPIRYDPYSPNADEQYEEIKKSLSGFDLLGMLTSELQKSKINQSFSRQLIKAFAATDDRQLSSAFQVICKNFNELYPIYTTIMQVAIGNWERLSEDTKLQLRDVVRALVSDKSFILKTDINVAYLIKLLAQEHSTENEEILLIFYSEYSDSVLIRQLVTQIMTKWRAHYWLSDIKKTFPTMDARQRRTFILSSYFLGDEGKHWRDHNKKNFNAIELLYRDWASERVNKKDLEKAL
ncbi:RNA-directed DNA polymerase [Marinobacter sp. 2_MG-2023]|uniref:RNA-directed DNA polymerase n=1 Tax=Marinobacter sp. 2_MG-2023 TaxID=3062679 RepID=UPI0026E2E43F|nr:RNA-directed DNA polymerase [Marinobacter sp. 2_MG-2023]MDO6443607.1 RNA-directed DNA polymerase [Marinobacter sp. 2_MG-2023]